MNEMQKALIYKDVKEVTASKQAFIPMIIVPVVLMVFIPTMFLVIAYFSKGGLDDLQDMDMLIRKLPESIRNLPPDKLMIKMMLSYMFPSFFLLIPIMTSSIVGASSFVGEKEHKTMETLLYTPITIEELFAAKVWGVFILSAIVTVVAFIAFGIVMNIGGAIFFGRLIFPDIKWLIILLWLSPSVALFALIFTVLVSAKSATFQEAQQFSALVVIPVILIMVGQMTGLFILGNLALIIIGGLLFAIDYLLVKAIAKNFIPEKLI